MKHGRIKLNEQKPIEDTRLARGCRAMWHGRATCKILGAKVVAARVYLNVQFLLTARMFL